MNKNRNMLIVIVGLALLGGLFVYGTGKIPTGPGTPTPTVTATPTPLVTPLETATPTPTEVSDTKTFSLVPPDGYTGFFETFLTVDNELVYIAYPMTISLKNPPDVLAYFHGSEESVTQDFASNTFMKTVRGSAAQFVAHNYVYITGNQDRGYASASASSKVIFDTLKALTARNMPYSKNYYVIGFSRGGIASIRFAMNNYKVVKKLALLAPVNEAESYTKTDYAALKKVPTQIWHGTADVNVPYSATTYFVSQAKANGVTLVVHKLAGKIHWDVDSEYNNDIIKFFDVGRALQPSATPSPSPSV